MYECFHCGHKAVIWDADFDYSDFELEDNGIIHYCHCTHCGAEIEYYVTFSEKDIEEVIEKSK